MLDIVTFTFTVTISGRMKNVPPKYQALISRLCDYFFIYKCKKKVIKLRILRGEIILDYLGGPKIQSHVSLQESYRGKFCTERTHRQKRRRQRDRKEIRIMCTQVKEWWQLPGAARVRNRFSLGASRRSPIL